MPCLISLLHLVIFLKHSRLGTKGSGALWVTAHLYHQIDDAEAPQHGLMQVITSLGTD